MSTTLHLQGIEVSIIIMQDFSTIWTNNIQEIVLLFQKTTMIKNMCLKTYVFSIEGVGNFKVTDKPDKDCRIGENKV